MKSKMKRTFIKSAIVLLIVIPTFAALFYWFITADRPYSCTKEFEGNLTTILSDSDYRIIDNTSVPAEEIKLPFFKSIRVFLQRNLNKINLGAFGKEFGIKYKIESVKSNEVLYCNGRFAGEHLMGIVVEYKNISTEELNILKNKFSKQFPNNKVLWIKLLL